MIDDQDGFEDGTVVGGYLYTNTYSPATHFFNEYLYYENKLYYCYSEVEDLVYLIPYKLQLLTKGFKDVKSLRVYEKQKGASRLVVDKMRVTRPYIVPVH